MLKTALKIGCAFIALTTPVSAQDYTAQKGLKGIELLPGWRTPSGTHMAAVRISLEDGWKTYWRAPGGIGIPPRFNWKGSKNMASVYIHWPSPKLYVQDGVRTIGYNGDFILPIEITPKITGQEITAKALVDFGVCNDVCIPVTSRIGTKLTVDEIHHQSLIKASLATKPRSAKAGGVKSISCQVDHTSDGLNITANITFKNSAPKVQQAVIEFAQPNIWINQTTLKTTGKSMTAKAELVSYSGEPFFMDRRKLRVTLIGQSNAIEINGCPAP